MITPSNESTPGAVKDMLLARRPHRCWDLWTIALTSGITLRWTSADIDLTVGGNTFLSQVCITRDKCKLTTGVETATQMMTVGPRSSDGSEPNIGGIPMRQAIRCGLFDGAAVRLEWAYYDLGYPPQLIGTVLRFTGSVGDIDAFAAKSSMAINSPLKRLDLEIPWKAYGAGCRYILGDSDCGADVAAHAVSGAVTSGSSNGTVMVDIDAVNGAWAGGTIALTSGDSATFRRSIRTNVGGALALKTPLPWAPLPGDTVVIYPGCNKTAPTPGLVSLTATIPAGKTLSVATTSTFAADLGVTLIGLTHTTPGGDDGFGNWIDPVTTKDPNTAMVKVTGTPAAGEYSVAAGVYTFAAANIGRQVKISASTTTGGEGGCARFYGAAAALRFGGMKHIPSPETAY